MKTSLRPVLPALAWLILVTVLLTLPGSAFPQEDWLSKIYFDKWVHIGLFSVMVFLWCRAWQKNTFHLKWYFLWVAVIFLIYGVGMEFIQKYFIPNRSFDWGDILADAIGCSLGLWISLRVYAKK